MDNGYIVISHEAGSSSLQTNKEQEPQSIELFSNYCDIAQAEAEKRAPEFAQLITQIIQEIDRQGINSFETFEFQGGKWPVSTVSVTEIFRKLLQDQVTRPEGVADKEGEPQKRVTVIIPGFSPPPVGHPFTPWDYVYNQVYTDLRRLIGSYRRGEPLPEIDVRVLGSANSDWGEVSPQFLQAVQERGFNAHGEMVAEYLHQEVLEGSDYVRVDGISMGSLIATEAIEYLFEEDMQKMQFVLDNPADQYYSSRLLRMLRAVQLPLGMGLDYAQVLARLPHYGKVYKGEPGFLENFNKHIAQRDGQDGELAEVPSDDAEKLALKKQAFKAECLLLLKQPVIDLDKRVFVRKGVTDLTTSTFGDVMFNLVQKMRQKKLFRRLGNRNLFTVNSGHQRENFAIERWVRTLKGGLDPEIVNQEKIERSEQKSTSLWKKLFGRLRISE